MKSFILFRILTSLQISIIIKKTERYFISDSVGLKLRDLYPRLEIKLSRVAVLDQGRYLENPDPYVKKFVGSGSDVIFMVGACCFLGWIRFKIHPVMHRRGLKSFLYKYIYDI